VEARVHQLHDFEHKGDDMTHAILTSSTRPSSRHSIAKTSIGWPARSMTSSILSTLPASDLVIYKINRPPKAAASWRASSCKQATPLPKACSCWRKNGDIMPTASR